MIRLDNHLYDQALNWSFFTSTCFKIRTWLWFSISNRNYMVEEINILLFWIACSLEKYLSILTFALYIYMKWKKMKYYSLLMKFLNTISITISFNFKIVIQISSLGWKPKENIYTYGFNLKEISYFCARQQTRDHKWKQFIVNQRIIKRLM